MARIRFLALPALIVCCTAMVALAGIEKGGGDRTLLRIPQDPNSTFEIGNDPYVFPLDTVALPVYLHSDSLVSYIENRITWEGDDLVLLSVTAGPGLPTGVEPADTLLDASTLLYTISGSPPFQVPDGDPIVYLNFEVQCYGYWQSTTIELVDDNNYNFFIAGGLPYAPLRTNGYVRTGYPWNTVLWNQGALAYAGQQHVPVPFVFSKSVPGALTLVRIVIDQSYVHYDSITPGGDVLGGDIVVTEYGDTLVVDLSGTTQTDVIYGEDDLFTLHFGFETDDDGYETCPLIVYAEWTTECGDVLHPAIYTDEIVVPDHTALANIGEVSYYTSASTYDVPFVLDSSMPVNDYEFWVEFPADSIEFIGVVAVGGFTAPIAGVPPSDTTLIGINNGPNTNYDPGDLPATVFKLRFQRRFSMPAGTYLYLDFLDSPENEVRYDMDDPFGYSTADLTTAGGYIRIKSIPNNTCPTLYVWNGGAFVLENSILAACDGKKVEHDVTDYYLIRNGMEPVDGRFLLEIREGGGEISTFRGFDLVAVDHPATERIQVTRKGEILSVGQPFSISWARDGKGKDIKDLIEVQDDIAYECVGDGWIEVSFGKLTEDQISNFVATSSEQPKEIEGESRSTFDKAAPDENRMDKKLKVFVKTAEHGLVLISEEDARRVPGRQATLLESGMIDPDEELVLRFAWEGYYRIDVLDFHEVEPFDGRQTVAALAGAEHSFDGAILHRLGDGEQGDPVILSPGQWIGLSFTVDGLPPLKSSSKREYILVTTGRYTTAGDGDTPTPRCDFVLDPNFPNPFNPSTVIGYNLPKAAVVELSIYDVRGALVRTLVAEYQDAGEKRVTWDGLNNLGQRVTSGVYFYRLRTPGFDRTRKMVLLR